MRPLETPRQSISLSGQQCDRHRPHQADPVENFKPSRPTLRFVGLMSDVSQLPAFMAGSRWPIPEDLQRWSRGGARSLWSTQRSCDHVCLLSDYNHPRLYVHAQLCDLLCSRFWSEAQDLRRKEPREMRRKDKCKGTPVLLIGSQGSICH